MDTPKPRRDFLKRSAAAGTLATFLPGARAQGANNRLRVGVMGLSRGMSHIAGFLAVPDVEIAAVCDVDSRRMAKAAETVEKKTGKRPSEVADFRKILEDKEVDVLSVAAPNFWHAPATILGCAAGKHVYVEKPGSHNANESSLMVEAARKFDRKVQMGNQRRSLPAMVEGIERIRAGEIGKVRVARCWYDSKRGSIGRGKPVPVPDWLNYDLWQGPAPLRPYKDNLVHYNWHWHWHWGGGEMANNGVHALDIARWALGVDLPSRVTCNGGRYYFDDDQETPDACSAAYDFGGDVMATWESSSCDQRKQEKNAFVSVYGSKGTVAFSSGGYRIYAPDGEELAKSEPKFTDVPHFQNFADAIREGAPLNAEIEDAQRSALLCHYANAAYRSETVVHLDPVKGKILSDRGASKFLSREYREGWEPKV